MPEPKQRHFVATNGDRTFCIFGQWFCLSFQASNLYKEWRQVVIQINMVVSRRVKKGKGPAFPVSTRRSKLPQLKVNVFLILVSAKNLWNPLLPSLFFPFWALTPTFSQYICNIRNLATQASVKLQWFCASRTIAHVPLWRILEGKGLSKHSCHFIVVTIKHIF